MSAETPILNLDDDPDNANWLRILAQRRLEQQQQDEPPMVSHDGIPQKADWLHILEPPHKVD